jgi:putative transposase
MPNFHRFYSPDAIVFITCVTQNRHPYLRDEMDIQLFFETLRKVQNIYTFELLAYVILPDHFHLLLHPENDSGDFSTIIHSLKRNFTVNYKKSHKIITPLKLWQNRFWDHVIRSENDLARHIQYIHWNPVKHGFVQSPEDWDISTFKQWRKEGFL